MTTRVALLGRDDAVRATLRTALVDAGAELAFEGDLSGADADAIRASVARILIINLEPGTDSELTALDPLIDDPSIDVLFNEAEVTGQLAGWDLARWARHLVAKVLGHGDSTPPPPPGAEMLPERSFMPRPGAPRTPAQEVGDSNIADFAGEVHASLSDLPQSTLPDALAASPAGSSNAAEPAEEATDDAALPRLLRDAPIAAALETASSEAAAEFSFDLGEIEGALSSIGSSAPAPSQPAATVQIPQEAGLELGIDFDAEALGFGADETADTNAAGADTALLAEGMDLDFSEIEASLAGIDSVATPAASDEPVDLGMGLDLDFDLNDDQSSGIPSLDDSGATLDLDSDADFAALAAQFDAQSNAAPAKPSSDVGGFDFSLEDMSTDSAAGDAVGGLDALLAAAPAEKPVPTPAAKPAAAPAAAPKTGPSFGALSLSDMNDTPAAEAPKPAKSSFDFSSLSLSLEPLPDGGEEEAKPAPAVRKAPPAATLGTSSLSLESFDDQDEAPNAAPASAPIRGIPRVFVLGASIGGPDALRTFLAHIPAEFPGLFVLAQHLDNGFFTRLAQQLQKTSKMLIRVADDNQGPAKVGQLLVVTSAARYRFDREGAISQVAYAEPPHYKPCIDDLFKDVADGFGKDVVAIIFSGMAGDAVEGASYVTAKGGEVWVQDPASCVVSSMVDGARARGVVEFTGSPRELAERCVARFGGG